MSTESDGDNYTAPGMEKKAMGLCPFCGEKPQKSMENKGKKTETSVLQKCKNGHIWRSLYAIDA